MIFEKKKQQKMMYRSFRTCR